MIWLFLRYKHISNFINGKFSLRALYWVIDYIIIFGMYDYYYIGYLKDV